MHKKWNTVLNKCVLFNNITEEELPEALSLLQAKQHEFKKGEIILRYYDPVDYAIVLLKGKAVCTLYEPIEKPFVVLHVHEGGIMALAVAHMENVNSPGEITASTDCKVLLLNVKGFLSKEHSDSICFSKIRNNIISGLSEHVQTMNQRLRMAAHGRVSDRIELYYHSLSSTDEDGYKHIPLSMKDLADYLHVDKSAMYKTLKQLKREGEIALERKKLKFLKRK